MDEREFVACRQPQWDKLGAIIARASGGTGLKGLSREELRELGPLYRRAASDLAYARGRAVSLGLITYINQLVARSYSLLYQADSRSWGGLLGFFTHELPRTFRRRISFFLASTGLMAIGAIVGYALVVRSQDNMQFFIPPGSMLHDSVEYWKSGKVTHKIPDAAAAENASFLMRNNTTVSFNAFAGGMLAGLPTAYVMFMNGAVLGGMAGLMTDVHQHHNFWPGIMPHGVVELSETCLAGAAGLSLGWAMLSPGMYRRRDALVLAARDSVKLIIGGVFLLIFAGLVEAYVSHSLLPKPFKIIFGIGSGIAMYSYLGFAGRNTESGRPNARAETQV
jgi:uncharacterized membrane protein SpoIIM required for sporulation